MIKFSLHPQEEFGTPIRFSFIHTHLVNKIADIALILWRRENSFLSVLAAGSLKKKNNAPKKLGKVCLHPSWSSTYSPKLSIIITLYYSCCCFSLLRMWWPLYVTSLLDNIWIVTFLWYVPFGFCNYQDTLLVDMV